MTIVIVDDEPLALKATVSAVREALPEGEIHDFLRWSAMLDFAGTHPIDIAFLALTMRGITGLALAGNLQV
ncbi:MAG: response regulator, partial [Clostridia bacterium]|nr:response regulator [Clostridia bacterium]